MNRAEIILALKAVAVIPKDHPVITIRTTLRDAIIAELERQDGGDIGEIARDAARDYVLDRYGAKANIKTQDAIEACIRRAIERDRKARS